MKRKLLMVCLISLLTATTMYARTPGDNGYKTVIRDFIDSHMTSNFKKLNQVLDENSTVKIPRGEAVIVQDKLSLISDMKGQRGVQQNCSSAYEVLAQSDALVIARVDFNYHDTIQHNYLILEKNDKLEWKITQVCKMFDDLETPGSNGNGVIAKN